MNCSWLHRPILLVLLAAWPLAACTRPKIDPRKGRPPFAITEAAVVTAAVASDGFATISWAAIADATAYYVYFSTAPGVSSATGTLIITDQTTLTHGGLVNGQTYYYVVAGANVRGIGPVSAQSTVAPVNGAGAADTLFADQWHLLNTGQNGATAGEDANVAPVWAGCGAAATCRGENVRVAVVDDGLEIGHEDLIANVASGRSYNYVTGSLDPTNESSDTESGHGTAVGGVIAARDLNGKGVRGIAPRANLVGFNLLQNYSLSAVYDALTRDVANVSVSNNSWGPADGYGVNFDSPTTWITGVASGLTTGRQGLGTIYVIAGGNGFTGNDDCPTCADDSNLDGQANIRGVIAAGAVKGNGVKSSYSEPGANILVSAPSGEYCSTLTTTTTDRTGDAGINTAATATDLADKAYTKCMNGTSSAAPVVAGVAALVLQAKPTLGWRDVRLILATTARKNDPTDIGWATNSAGLNINHKYGFGVVDAQAAVAAATAYVTNLGTELTYTSALSSPALAVPDNDNTGVNNTITVAGSGITKIEFIEITFSGTHLRNGDLEITLTNTSTVGGAVSTLAPTRTCLFCDEYDAWTFSSSLHLNEPANGIWRLTVKDKAAGITGTFNSWKIKFYGT